MVERYQGEQLPPVHPDPYGRPPQPDGQTVPQPSRRLPLATRQVVYGWICAAIVVLAVALKLLGWLP